MMRLLLVVVIAWIASLHLSGAFAQMSETPEVFVASLNSQLDGANGGIAISAEIGQCFGGKPRACTYSGYDGIVGGRITTDGSGQKVLEITIAKAPTNENLGMFFATLAGSLEVLAPQATSEERRDAVLTTVEILKKSPGPIEKKVGSISLVVFANREGLFAVLR